MQLRPMQSSDAGQWLLASLNNQGVVRALVTKPLVTNPVVTVTNPIDGAAPL